MLKTGLLIMASTLGIAAETKAIIELPFGKSYDLPLDFRFNDVPHAQWVRSYIYDSVRNAVVKAIYDEEFDKKSKMQIKLNFPEGNTHMLTALKVLYWTDKGFIVNYLLFWIVVNPAFDTYRIGTILECVRTVSLTLAEDYGKRVRICVQQSLGEGAQRKCSVQCTIFYSVVCMYVLPLWLIRLTYSFEYT